jgi:hypothetical protein
MDPFYIKLISSVVAGVLALLLCKAYDMFYHLEYTKVEYAKSFVAGFIVAFVALYAFEFITAKSSQIQTVAQLGGAATEIKLPGVMPNLATQFKYNTGIPNF